MTALCGKNEKGDCYVRIICEEDSFAKNNPIVIDKENGIDLEDCEKVNNEITDLLDEADYIKEQYFLEV